MINHNNNENTNIYIQDFGGHKSVTKKGVTRKKKVEKMDQNTTETGFKIARNIVLSTLETKTTKYWIQIDSSLFLFTYQNGCLLILWISVNYY